MRISDWSSDVCSSDLFGGVADGVEAAEEEGGDAEAVIGEDRVGHLFRRADEAGGVAEGAGGAGDAHPQALVMHLLLFGEGELAAAGIVDGGAHALALLPRPAQLGAHAGADAHASTALRDRGWLYVYNMGFAGFLQKQQT